MMRSEQLPALLIALGVDSHLSMPHFKAIPRAKELHSGIDPMILRQELFAHSQEQASW